MKEFTVIWEKRWRDGSHAHSMTKKTLVRAPEIESVMKSMYGDCAVYIFEGFQFTIGESFHEEEVVELL